MNCFLWLHLSRCVYVCTNGTVIFQAYLGGNRDNTRTFFFAILRCDTTKKKMRVVAICPAFFFVFFLFVFCFFYCVSVSYWFSLFALNSVFTALLPLSPLDVCTRFLPSFYFCVFFGCKKANVPSIQPPQWKNRVHASEMISLEFDNPRRIECPLRPPVFWWGRLHFQLLFFSFFLFKKNFICSPYLTA